MDYTGKVITKNPVTPTQASASGVWTLDEALQAQKGNNWPVPGVYNPISRSLRFNSADSAYLNWTPTFVGNRRTWTLSFWLKRTTLGTAVTETILATNDDNLASGNFDNIRLTTTGGITDKLEFYSYSTGYSIRLITTQVFRDPSAWYHFVIAVDTTQSTASNRVKIYLNGSQITAFTTETYPSQNYQTYINNAERQNLGVLRNVGSGLSQYLNGYMTEVNFIDGQALTPSDVGLTDPATGVWVPKKYTGTYGTNGFYLNFKDNSNTTTIGYDYSGNSNNWTPNNFSVTAGAGNDSLTDVPTPWIGYSSGGDTGGVVRGNYATLNPLNLPPSNNTLSNGNLDNNMNVAGQWGAGTSTVSVSSGKWYAEFKVNTVSGSPGFAVGISTTQYQNERVQPNGYYGNFWYYSYGYAYLSDGRKYTNNSDSAYGATYTSGDVIGVALDLDAGTVVFYKNGVSQGTAYSSLSGTFTINTSAIGQQSRTEANFGQRPFAYTPPAGYRSLCTTNLPTPAIGTSSTTLADDYFNTVLYTGTGSTLGVTGVGFQPDFVWIKSRSAATDHALYDVVRGDKNQLESNTATAETNETTGLTQFNADGFTVGSLAQVNTNTATYVAWNWKAGGAGVTNTAGSITSTVSANTTAGFSIVTYTGTGSNATVGHGCLVNGVATAPSMLIVKRRSAADAWYVFHTSLPSGYAIQLNNSTPDSSLPTIFNSTAPTSTVFSIGTDSAVNANTATYIAYCFAPVAGYSAFGSYTGNGSADGPFIYTGFRPEWILVKPNSTSGSWLIHDAARDPYNVSNLELQANANSAEYNTNTAGAGDRFDLLSNGFKNRSSNAGANGSGATYIYAAFAESPFKYANAR